MSQIIRSTFKWIYNVLKIITHGWLLQKDIWARFATWPEAYSLINSKHNGVLIDGKNRRLSNDLSFASIWVFSPPKGGKTSGYIIPNICDRSQFECSMLITDPSGEIYAQTSKNLKEKGFNVLVLDPLDLTTSIRFNPFDWLGKSDIIEIEKICASIIMTKYWNDKEAIWNEGAIALLEVFAKCLAYSDPENLNLPNLNYLLQQFGSDGSNLDEWVSYHSVNPDDIEDKSIFQSWYGITTANPGMLTSFVTIARTALKQFNNPNVQALFERNEVDFEDFRQQKTAIYIKLSEDQADYFQFLIDVFYAKFFAAMMKGAPDRSKLDVYCYLDEFWSSYVDNFSMIINNIRKYRVSLSLVFQGVSQIDEKYGEKKAKSITTGILTSIVYGWADPITAKLFSDKIGTKITKQKRQNSEDDINYASTPLLPPEAIRTIASGKALLVSSNQPAFIFKFKQYFKPGSPFKAAIGRGEYTQPVRDKALPKKAFSIWKGFQKNNHDKNLMQLRENDNN